jgi:hypothetical protein
MKNKIIILFLFIFGFNNNSFATFKYKVGDFVSGGLNISSKHSIPLTKGDWQVIYWYGEHLFRGIHVYTITLAQIENKKPTKILEISKIDGLSAIYGYINPIIITSTFKSKRHGCVERSYYTLLKYYRSKGATHNCLSIKHYDVNYELYENNDPNRDLGYLINWARKNNLIFPKTYLGYDLSVYIPRKKDRWLTIDYLETPESFANYTSLYGSETKSEFHPQNIRNYPNAKKVMNDWVTYISSYHDSIELGLRIDGKYKLKFDNMSQVSKNLNKNNKNNKMILDLKKLDDLYKSGVLSDEEFKKLKDKVINSN